MVYPRVGGGNCQPVAATGDSDGLSPRGRGKRHADTSGGRAWRSIPAWAGETREAVNAELATEVYPRVGGGNGYQIKIASHGGGLSPRGRGKRFRDAGAAEKIRSIPAWAGETSLHRPLDFVLEVYPRVGGGNRASDFASRVAKGLSPRGRGKLAIGQHVRYVDRSIPAWAGETINHRWATRTQAVYPRVGGGNFSAGT